MDMLKKYHLCDIVKIKISQMFVLFENKVSYENFFAKNSFKSCHRYIICIAFSVKSWSKEAQGYKSNIFLTSVSIWLSDVFFRESMIEICKINPWGTSTWISVSRKWAFTEVVRYFGSLEQK